MKAPVPPCLPVQRLSSSYGSNVLLNIGGNFVLFADAKSAEEAAATTFVAANSTKAAAAATSFVHLQLVAPFASHSLAFGVIVVVCSA